MSDMLSAFVRYGYLVLFGVILLENLGAPIPGFVLLIGAGALAAVGRLSLALALALAVLAALLGDLVWYGLGRWRGRPILKLLCRLSLNPDTCVGNTENFFLRHGLRTLLLAKFVPGVNTIAPPLMGTLRARLVPFLSYDFAGVLIFAGVFLGIGYLLGWETIGRAEAFVSRMGVFLGWGTVGSGVAYIAWRFALRLRVRKALRTVGVTPAELRRRQENGSGVTVIDVRSPLAVKEHPRLITDAIRAGQKDLDRLAETLPREQPIVTYCV